MAQAIPKRGELYWIEFPKGKSGEPAFRHPGLVLSNDAFNTNAASVTVIPTTTREKALRFQLLLIPPTGNLENESVLQVEMTTCVNKSRLGDRIGRLDSELMREISDTEMS